MKKIIIIPDSFKGSLTSEEVTDIIAGEIQSVYGESENLQIYKLPIADGGEGSTECILNSLGGEKKTVIVKSPENKDIEAYYGVINKNNTKTTVIEIAQSSGITRQISYNAKAATTYGFGQLIKDALNNNCRDFLLCLGGSATTDCGAGMAAALGAVFTDSEGNAFLPTGGTLNNVAKIDISTIDERIADSTFTVMCDVENPLYGKNGAAYIYGPQKGATTEDIIIMDEGLKNVSKIFNNLTGKDLAQYPGAGAAGGAGYGCMAFLNAKMKSGIEAMLEIVDFDSKVKDCDLVITGEGRIDEQSFMGKVLSGIIKHSKGTKIVAFCGCCELAENKAIDIIEIGRGVELQESIRNAAYYLKKVAREYFEKLN